MELRRFWIEDSSSVVFVRLVFIDVSILQFW
jgi:hypothetical protein